MNPDSGKASSSKSRTTVRPLKRGRACMNCRLLKIKCDGVKPVCGPCFRHPKDDDCEYSDGPVRSKTKILEETIARLEARLRDIEHPEETTPSVTLHDPYPSYGQSQEATSPDSPSQGDPPMISPLSSTSSLPFGTQWRDLSGLPFYTNYSPGSSSSPAFSTEPNSPELSTTPEEPPVHVIPTILDFFLPHASQFGFFLNSFRFREQALLLPRHPSRPSPALTISVYLWGVHLSQSDAFLVFESKLLRRAVQEVATATNDLRSDNILHVIQAQVLLGYYFFRNRRFVEAQYHASGALSLALACGLHKIRSSQPRPPLGIGAIENVGITLTRPQDGVEEGERINGFWAVFTLQKVLAVALDSPSILSSAFEAPGMQIDTPWPMDMERYKEGLLVPEVEGAFTLRNMLNDPARNPEDWFSAIAMNVKATILFHRAANLAAQWSTNTQFRDSQMFNSAFTSLDRLVNDFKAKLPLLAHFQLSAHPMTRTLAVTHALTDAATINLYNLFVDSDTGSKQRCLAAARGVVGVVRDGNLEEWTYINPVMGTVLMTACRVFVGEIAREKAVRANWSPDDSVGEALAGLQTGMAAMAMLSKHNNALMGTLYEISAYSYSRILRCGMK